MKSHITQVDYGAFLRQIDSGKMKSVEVQDNQIGFVAADNEGKERVYVTGRMDDPDLVNRLYNANVQFTKLTPRENSPLVNFLLSWILPMAIFIGFGQLSAGKMQSKMGGMGNAMAFGKSNAKIYVEAQTGKSFVDVAGQDEAKEALQEIIDYLHNPQKYKENDIEQATKIARVMVTRFGMSEEFGVMALETVNNQYLGGDTSLLVSAETASKIDDEVLKIIKSCHIRAIEILEQNKNKLHELTKHLLEKETITGEEFMSILAE